MLTRQRLVTYGISSAAFATIALVAGLTPWTRQAIEEPQATVAFAGNTGYGREVDVVFAVDTTGSMSGLIEGAKRTVWSIANHIKKTDANASVRIGLVAYRDITDDYITREFPLTGDLDAVFAELSSYYAAGGNDIPEHVNAALDVTLHKMKWRPNAKKLVFLVGDAPPAERGDVPTFEALAREAGNKQIVINTIHCVDVSNPESAAQTADAFQQIASLSHGAFSAIQQNGGVQQIATPYDDKLAELSARIDSTAIIAGDEGVRRNYALKMEAAAAAPPAAKADRAAYFAGEGVKGRASNDVVGGIATGAMTIDGIAEEDLPAEYRGMDKDTFSAEVRKRVAERDAAQKEIAEITRKREEYLADKAKDAGGEGGFDVKVKQALEAQLK